MEIVRCVNWLIFFTRPIDWPSGVSAGQFDTTNDGELSLEEAIQGLVALQKQSNNYKKMVPLKKVEQFLEEQKLKKNNK